MNKAQQNSLVAKVMAIPGMELTHDASYQLDESPARDMHRTHFRFTSDLGAVDNQNGDTFVKFLREQGVNAEQRYRKLIVVENTELVNIFKL